MDECEKAFDDWFKAMTDIEKENEETLDLRFQWKNASRLSWFECWRSHVLPKTEGMKWFEESNKLLQDEVKSLRQIVLDNQCRYSGALEEIKRLEKEIKQET